MTTKAERDEMRKMIETGQVSAAACAAVDKPLDRLDAALGLPRSPRTRPTQALFVEEARAAIFRLLADIEERDKVLTEIVRDGTFLLEDFCGLDCGWERVDAGKMTHGPDCLVRRIQALLG